MRKIVPMSMLPLKKRKKSEENKEDENKRFLITINVVGSAGPLRFVVSEGDSVKRVISSAIKLYARQGRLPVLSSDASTLILFPANAEFTALEPSVSIGSPGVRNFLLCKKTSQTQKIEGTSPQKAKGNWKIWIQKILHPNHMSNKLITC